jgi:hypothetical protein
MASQPELIAERSFPRRTLGVFTLRFTLKLQQSQRGLDRQKALRQR